MLNKNNYTHTKKTLYPSFPASMACSTHAFRLRWFLQNEMFKERKSTKHYYKIMQKQFLSFTPKTDQILFHTYKKVILCIVMWQSFMEIAEKRKSMFPFSFGNVTLILSRSWFHFTTPAFSLNRISREMEINKSNARFASIIISHIWKKFLTMMPSTVGIMFNHINDTGKKLLL